MLLVKPASFWNITIWVPDKTSFTADPYINFLRAWKTVGRTTQGRAQPEHLSAGQSFLLLSSCLLPTTWTQAHHIVGFTLETTQHPTSDHCRALSIHGDNEGCPKCAKMYVSVPSISVWSARKESAVWHRLEKTCCSLALSYKLPQKQ